MPSTFVLEDFVTDELGNPKSGIHAQAYLKMTDGTRISWGSGVDTNVAGKWSITIDSAAVLAAHPTGWSGFISVDLTNPASLGQKRRREGDAQLQLASFVGAFGDAPIADNSVTGPKLQDNSVTDTKLTTFTIPGSPTPSAYTTAPARLSTILQWYAKRFKEVTGLANWSDTLPYNLSQTVRNKSGTPGIYGLSVAPTPSSPSSPAQSDGDLAIVHGSAAGVYKRVLGAWQQVASNAAAVLPSSSLPQSESVGSSGSAGTATTYSRSDHRHSMPPLASSTTAGFMSGADKAKLDSLTTGGGGGGGNVNSGNAPTNSSNITVTSLSAVDAALLSNMTVFGGSGNALITASVTVFCATGVAGTAKLTLWKNGNQINGLEQDATIPAGVSGASGYATLSLSTTALVTNGDDVALHVDNIGGTTITVLANSAALSYVAFS